LSILIVVPGLDPAIPWSSVIPAKAGLRAPKLDL
jgi:hypothetical protein